MAIRYISTRGNAPDLNFEEVLLAGLAADGGLYVPDKLPTFSEAKIRSFRGMSYPELAFNILEPFVEGSIASEDLRDIIDDTYGQFRHPAEQGSESTLTRAGEWALSSAQ